MFFERYECERDVQGVGRRQGQRCIRDIQGVGSGSLSLEFGGWGLGVGVSSEPKQVSGFGFRASCFVSGCSSSGLRM